MACSGLGVVVVGMGIAGRVRVRDIKAAQEGADNIGVELKGYVSRRELDIDGVTPVDMETALTRDDVHLVIVATENKTHEVIARKALEAGKHVLVEFPLATNATAVKSLQDLAESKGLVCHEEVISLLSDEYLTLKEMVRAKPALQHGSVTLTAKYNGWIENFEDSGSPFTSGIFQLHTLSDLFGELTAASANIKREDDGFMATADIATRNGTIKIQTTRKASPETRRTKTYCYEFSDGSTIDRVPPSDPKPPGLFQRDLLQVVARITKGDEVVPSPCRTLRCHLLADELYRLCNTSQ